MSYTAWSVVFGEQPSASKWNILGTNDAGFKDGTNIDDNAILARHLASGIVTANELDLDPASSSVATSQSTSSTSYTDLATVHSVAVTVGANGILLVSIASLIYYSAGTPDTYMSFALSGANTLAASDARSISNKSANGITVGASFLLTGLAAGATTVTAKHKVNAGASTGVFLNRNLFAIPL